MVCACQCDGVVQSGYGFCTRCQAQRFFLLQWAVVRISFLTLVPNGHFPTPWVSTDVHTQTRAFNDLARQQWLQLSDDELEEAITRETQGLPLRRSDVLRARGEGSGTTPADPRLPTRWYLPVNALVLPVMLGFVDAHHPFLDAPNLQEAMTEALALVFAVEARLAKDDVPLDTLATPG